MMAPNLQRARDPGGYAIHSAWERVLAQSLANRSSITVDAILAAFRRLTPLLPDGQLRARAITVLRECGFTPMTIWKKESLTVHKQEQYATCPTCNDVMKRFINGKARKWCTKPECYRVYQRTYQKERRRVVPRKSRARERPIAVGGLHNDPEDA